MTPPVPPTGQGSTTRADWQLIRQSHAVYATRDGRYEVRRHRATAADRDWVILAHPHGDAEPGKSELIFVKSLGSFTGGRTVMAAGITLAILVLPIVIITSAEAIRASTPWPARGSSRCRTWPRRSAGTRCPYPRSP